MELPNDEVQLLSLIREYKDQLQTDPTSNVFLSLAHCYNKLDLIEAALDVVRCGIQNKPDHVAGLVLLAELLMSSNEYDESCATYERVLRLDAQNCDALIGLTRLDLRQHNYDRAEDRIKQLEDSAPHSHAIQELRSQLKSVNTASGDGILLPTATMAELYLNQGLKEKAISIYRSLMHRHPDEAKYRHRLADLLGQPIADKEVVDINNHAIGLEKWLIAIERRRKNV